MSRGRLGVSLVLLARERQTHIRVLDLDTAGGPRIGCAQVSKIFIEEGGGLTLIAVASCPANKRTNRKKRIQQSDT